MLRWLQDRPGSALLLAVDDMHWADADSLALVSFLCRRMGALRLGLIATLRPWPSRPGRPWLAWRTRVRQHRAAGSVE